MVLRRLCKEQVALFIKEQAAHWKQRGKCRVLHEGDANTRYFHARASARLRHNRIQQLKGEGATLYAHDAKVTAITMYYTSILGHSNDTTWAFDLARLYEGRLRTDEKALIAPFDATEAWQAIRTMKLYSASAQTVLAPASTALLGAR